VLGLGDSIMCGPEEGAFGVPPRAWPQWLAEALDLPFHRVCRDGAFARDLVALLDRARFGYTLACVHVGTNDVRSVDWDPAGFESALGALLAGVRAERVAITTIPLDLGRPRAGAKVRDANAIIERRAHATGTLVVDLAGFRGRRVLMADHVHPTAFGQIAIAERALDVLERDGLRAGCPRASRVPYELQIAPLRAEPEALRSDLLGAALQLLAELVRRVQRARNGALTPLNAWVHDGAHWHIEMVPRTTRLAGLELGAGVYINPLAPDDAAAALR
jgi:lysophospholipase L1-like esterase